jgi:hypothetical protein
MRHETLCTLYRLVRTGQEIEAENGWPVTSTDELVGHLKATLFGEEECTTPERQVQLSATR